MGRVVSIGAHQVKVKPRPLVGTKTFILKKQREMRDDEWSAGFGGMFVGALLDNEREKICAHTEPGKKAR